MIESTDISVERASTQSHLEASRHKITWRCNRCGGLYSKVAASPNTKDPLCQRRACVRARIEEDYERRNRNLSVMIEAGAGPPVVGQNNVVKAVDKTAEIVMHDHKMTNLQDNLREGDIAAPKLRPDLQSKVDHFFDGGTRPGARLNSGTIMRRAIGGAYKTMAVPPSVAYPSNAKPGEKPYRIRGNGRDFCTVSFRNQNE